MSGTEGMITKRLKEAGIDIYKGNGRFIDTKTFLIENKKLETDYVIIATGTTPAAPPGITLDGKKVISHIEALKLKKLPSIFAAGDVNGIHDMAHIAIQQGMLITKGLEGKKVIRGYSSLPRAMFTLPEIAGAGEQEWELIKECTPYRVRSFELKDTWRAYCRGIDTGFIKMILDTQNIIIGIWMTGADASEILSASGILIGQRLSESMIMDNLFIHPSLGEGIPEAIFKSN